MKELLITTKQTPSWDTPLHACIGYFDGIHLGHQRLIETAVAFAREQGGMSALITFEPDPWTIIKGIRDIPHLMSMEQRKQIAASLGVECWIILDFTEEMSALSVEQFHEQILFPLPLKNLVCGFDFHYGYHGSGNINTLQAQDHFPVTIIDEISNDCAKISSTRIETYVRSGNMEKAQELLTRPYQMQGIVVSGLQNGRKMGFPTANLQTDTHYVSPKEGVYVGQVQIDHIVYPAMINVGKNPTVADYKENRIEAHIFDFNQNLYGKHVTFSFLHYLRADQKFADLTALQKQLVHDQHQALAYLKERDLDAPAAI